MMFLELVRLFENVDTTVEEVSCGSESTMLLLSTGDILGCGWNEQYVFISLIIMFDVNEQLTLASNRQRQPCNRKHRGSANIVSLSGVQDCRPTRSL